MDEKMKEALLRAARGLEETASAIRMLAEQSGNAVDNAAPIPAEKKQAKKGRASSGGSLTESEQPITLEQIRSVLAEKSQAGLTMQVKDLVSSFGSVKLSGIDPAKYPELMEKAKALRVPDGGK